MTIILVFFFMGDIRRVPLTDSVECREVQQAFWTLFPHNYADCVTADAVEGILDKKEGA